MKEIIGCTLPGSSNDTLSPSSGTSFVHFYTVRNAEVMPVQTPELVVDSQNDD